MVHVALGVAGAVVYKAAVGYNSSNWGVNATISGNNFWGKGVSKQKYSITGGGLRFSVTKKFDTHKKKNSGSHHA